MKPLKGLDSCFRRNNDLPGFGRNSKVTTHGSDVLQFNGGIGRWLKRLVLTHADAVTALNPPLGDSVRELGYAGPLKICPMGVDTTAFSPERRSMAPSEGGRYPVMSFQERNQ